MAGGGGGPSEDDPYAVQINLVPLIDVLTNILFFLLVGFASTEAKYEGDMKLPSARTNDEVAIRHEITVSRTELLVGDVRIAKIKDGALDAPREGDKIIPLYEKLNTLRAARTEQTGGVSKEDDVMFLFADKDTPFTLLSPVMKTAAMAGFPNFRFAVVKK